MNKIRIATIFVCLGMVLSPLSMQETHARSGADQPPHKGTTSDTKTGKGNTKHSSKPSSKKAPTCTSNKSSSKPSSTSSTSTKESTNDLWTEITVHIKIRNSETRKSKCESTKPAKPAKPAKERKHSKKEQATKKDAKTPAKKATKPTTSKSTKPTTSKGATAAAPLAAAQGKGNIYAGLGDSVAAGAGLGPNGACDRSSLAYPNLVAKERNLRLIHAACSGATVGDLYTQQRISGINPRPQLDAAFARGKPDLITITAGANDVRWFDFLLKCWRGTCGSPEDERAIESFQNLLQGKLQFALSDIEKRSGGAPPKVVMTGYYSPSTALCQAIQPRITDAELQWINRHVQELNETLRNGSAQFRFVEFAPISFSGHDLCSNEPWVQGLNDPAPLHPTQRGHEAIAQSISRTL